MPRPVRRAIIVGGSLGGLFAGCMLRRAEWDVTIVERTAGRLEGRGAGLGVHPPMLEGLLRAGARVDASVGIPIGGRAVLARDGSIAAEVSMPQFCTSWARLYSLLSDVFPEERILRGIAVIEVKQGPADVTAVLSDGRLITADVLVGADGVRSTVRRQYLAHANLAYAGYIGWRGMVDEGELSASAHATLFHLFAWGLLPGEHILGYPVPGANDAMAAGRRRYSFVWYRPVPDQQALRDMQTDATGRAYPEGIPPQAIRADLVASLRQEADELLCPAWAEVVRSSPQPLFQPIGDLECSTMVFGRVALLGDAACVARPHVARGAIKAGHDAIALSECLAGKPVEEALAAYDAIRRPLNQAVVDTSRRLGAYLQGKSERTSDPVAFMVENGGVEPSNVDGGLFFRLLEQAGFGRHLPT